MYYLFGATNFMNKASDFYRDIVLIYVLLIFVEIAWSLYAKKNAYDFKESICTLFIAIVQRVIVSLGAGNVLVTFFYNNAPFKFTFGYWQFIPVILIADLVYYFQHRLHHAWPFLWSLHQVHHSSTKLNLIAANRQSWLDYPITLIIFSPLSFLGFHPYFVIFSIYATLFVQWYAHTTAIGKIPLLEGFFITPSAHRVHHSTSPENYNSNYGSILMIWDRLFGTYKKEKELVTDFGIKNFNYTNNPLKLTFQGPVDYIQLRINQFSDWLKGVKAK